MQEITDEMMENRKKHYKAENYQLEYSRGLSQPIYFSKILKGQKIDKYTKSYCHDNIERSVNVYKLSLTDDFLKSEKYNDKLVLSINEVVRKVKIELYISRPYANLIGDSFEVLTKHLFCNLRYCEIGFFHSCDRNSQNSGIFGALLTVFRSEMFGYYYIGFTSSNEYRNLILKLIPKNNDNKHVFNVVFCPGENWVHKRSEVDYFLDDSNLVGAILMDNSTRRLFLKLAYCHNNNNKIFIKCGRLDQKYMSSIDVGYECNDYNKEEANRIHNKDEKKTDMLVISNDILMCNGHNIFKSSSIIISVLPPENNFNKAGIFKVSKVNQTTNLYPEQELQLIDVNDIIKTHSGATEYLGYVVNYEPKCRVPYLNVKLYLKISDTIQKFENKANDNFGKIDTYVVDRKGINSVPVGCHVVFDEKKHPAFNHFYENCCQPSLLMFNGKTKKFIEITDIQSFQPNNMYKCALKVKNANSKSGQQKYIHETDFTINLIDPSLNKTSSSESDSTVWIIFVVFIIVIILLIVGLLILKKFKIKKSNNNSSTSSSQSTTKFSTVVSKIFNVPIIQKKNDFKTNMNMAKTIVTKNSNTNNKVTNFGQKLVGKNSNLINQTQNATKNVVAKTSNINLTNQTQNATKNVIAKNSNLNITNQTQNATKNVIAKNSNLNLVNQAKNAPKKTVGKNTNPKKISNVGDSVFKLK